MGYITIASGITLKVPDFGMTSWGQEFLDNFAKKISEHDHTGGGKGVQLQTDAYADGSITGAKLAVDIAQPPGAVVMTFATAAPAGWVLLQGQVVSRTGAYTSLFAAWGALWDLGSEGAGNWRLPDMRKKMPLGKDGTLTLGASGGSFDHTHTVVDHTHGMQDHYHSMQSHTHDFDHIHQDDHTHTIAHTHTINSHTHGIEHTHNVPAHYHGKGTINITGNPSSTHQHYITGVTPSEPVSGTALQAVYRASDSASSSLVTSNFPTGGAHSHDNSAFSGSVGATGGTSGDVDFGTSVGVVSGTPKPTSDGTSLTTNASSAANTGSRSQPWSAHPTSADGTHLITSTGAPSTANTSNPSNNTTTAAGAQTSSTNNPPYIVVNYMAKL